MLRLYVVLSVTTLCRTAASKKRTNPEAGGKTQEGQQRTMVYYKISSEAGKCIAFKTNA